MIDINGTATIDFVLTEKSMELINGDGDLVVIGHGFNLLKVTLVDAVPDTEEKVLWTGTHAVDWSTAWESSAELMTELKSVASVGTGLHLYCERTASDFCQGCAAVDWANICTGESDPNRGDIAFKGKVLLNFVLTEKSLQLLNQGNLGVVGHGFNLLKVTVVAPKSATAINQITSTPTQDNKVYYNLAGQRVENPGKGLYIVNGKKVMMKMRISCLTVVCLLAVSGWAQPTSRQWNSEVTAGWNLGNQLECAAPGQDGESTTISNPANAMDAETAWGNPKVTNAMIAAVKDAGFNAVRIPIRWQCHITDAATMAIDAAWLNRVKEVVGYCLDNGMKVIINTHHDKWLESRPTYYYQTDNNTKLSLLWTHIAEAFSDYDYDVAFAGTNEVHVPNVYNAPTPENLSVQNTYNQTFVNAVRATGGKNLKRHLIVQTYDCDPDFGMYNGDLIVPTDIEGNGNDYLSVEVHYYKPWEYCGSTAYYYWGTAYSGYGNIPTSNEQTMINAFQRMEDIWDSQGLGIIIGEWGVTDHWDKTTSMNSIRKNITYYCKTLVSEARSRGFATFVWDNNAFGNGMEKFGIFDRNNNMSLRASWTLEGIQQGVQTGISDITVDRNTTEKIARPFIKNGKILIRKDDKTYNLLGQPIEVGQ